MTIGGAKTALLVLATCCSFARGADCQSAYVGLSAGINVSTLHDPEPGDLASKWKNGVVAGASLALRPVRSVAARLEVLYSQKGVLTVLDGGRASTLLEYLEVSVLADVSIARRDGLSLGIVGGPWFGVFLGCRSQAPPAWSRRWQGCALQTQDIDAGVAIGVGTRLVLNPGTINLDLRYSFGLRSVYRTLPPIGITNRTLSLLSGFAVPLTL